MNCDEVQDRLGAFHDSELLGADRLAVEVHLGSCPACAAELGAIAELASFARHLAEPEPSADLWSRLAERLHEGLRKAGLPEQ